MSWAFAVPPPIETCVSSIVNKPTFVVCRWAYGAYTAHDLVLRVLGFQRAKVEVPRVGKIAARAGAQQGVEDAVDADVRTGEVVLHHVPHNELQLCQHRHEVLSKVLITADAPNSVIDGVQVPQRCASRHKVADVLRWAGVVGVIPCPSQRDIAACSDDIVVVGSTAIAVIRPGRLQALYLKPCFGWAPVPVTARSNTVAVP